jgi:hypothetical protein
MKYLKGLVLGIVISAGTAGSASAQECCPVRKVAKAAICTPVCAVRAVVDAKPVRRVAAIPYCTAKRIAAAKPVRSTFGRIMCCR